MSLEICQNPADGGLDPRLDNRLKCTRLGYRDGMDLRTGRASNAKRQRNEHKLMHAVACQTIQVETLHVRYSVFRNQVSVDRKRGTVGVKGPLFNRLGVGAHQSDLALG